MKLSKQTLDILKNFSQVNPSIFLKKGSFIMTKSINGVTYAEATISDIIDSDFGIYDLNSFLNVVNLVGADAEIVYDVETANITIKGERTKIVTSSADLSTIVTPKKQLVMPVADLVFEITSTQLSQIIKASRMMKLNTVSIEAIDGKLVISAKSKVDEASSYSLEIGDYDGENVFNFDISVDNMMFIDNNYKVLISAKGAAKFESEQVSYVVVLEATSKFK
ncbi:sliding clamp DNA polymerase [Pectobacterium phage POP12]|nr:sliding clamp DNA polymerase [Pectobacterium phage POP12]